MPSTPPLASPPVRIPQRIDPDRTLSPRSSGEIRELLDARQRDLEFHLSAIKNELTGFAGLSVGGRPLPDVLRAHALRNAGLAVAAGLALGLLGGWWTRRSRRVVPDEGFDLLRARLATVLDDAAERVASGTSAEHALRDVLRQTPVVYASAPEVASRQATSSIRQTVDMAVKSAAGFALKTAMDQITKKLTGHEETFAAVEDAANG